MTDYEKHIDVDFEKGEIVVVETNRYRLWHDFGGVKRFFIYSDMTYVQYLEKRGDGLYLINSHTDGKLEEEPISEDAARKYVVDAVDHWMSA